MNIKIIRQFAVLALLFTASSAVITVLYLNNFAAASIIKAENSVNEQNITYLSGTDIIIIDSILNGTSKEDLSRLVAINNITSNKEVGDLPLLIVLLGLFPNDVEALAKLLATDRTIGL